MVDWVDVFIGKEYKIVIVNLLNYFIKNKVLEVLAWCLMSNHIHLVCRANEGAVKRCGASKKVSVEKYLSRFLKP